MRLLVYLAHPAQYHFFKNIIRRLLSDGNELKILIKSKDVLEELLREDRFEYIKIQEDSRGKGSPAILLAALRRTAIVMRQAREFKAELLAGTDSSIAQVGFLLGKPSLTVLEDDYSVIKKLARITFPFSSRIVTPDICDVGPWKKKKIGYKGYMKLAALHPKYFSPDSAVPAKYGIDGDYMLIRAVSLNAYHDKGIGGLEEEDIEQAIKIAEKQGVKVYISSEIPLGAKFRNYALKIKPGDIFQIMAFSKLLLSDSQSMSEEAALLGIPSIRFSDFCGKISVLEELEHKYGLTFGFRTSQKSEMLRKTEEILSGRESADFKARRDKMLSDKIDVTDFFVRLIENYPR
ncbi:MAG: DUF354 domain-containing protein [Bacteroidales bacterium]|nr:DUF354 domain-containing protein [Bacteroidales bacterium]